MTSDVPSSLPLAGHVVIELGHSVAAPFAGQILADLGAEVIKIEKPAGDDARHWGPPFVDGAAATFQSLNRNKRSLVLDLREPASFARLKALIAERADVVLQNMRPGQVQSRWAWTPRRCARASPRWCTATSAPSARSGRWRTAPATTR